eukprot:CAMPEP_0182880248 /NCGR_PEP_ID=MMETSP0034_2-20130328/16454_1 /TAXON_ID=156128 /ORGANISM="Nephroselmis pyriformis, Strain CCMP717" /LENGTH=102 /DNA_ID=CAMNT_0025013229 /DNA_START=401 /DNA_END=706 /DNA_ORIENTATION=+
MPGGGADADGHPAREPAGLLVRSGDRDAAAPDPSLKYLEVHTGPSPLPLKPANKGAGPAATASWGGLARGVAARAERFDLENYGAPSTSTATLAFLRGTGPG